MLEFGRWTRNVLTWVVWAPCTVGLVAGDTQCWPGACPNDGICIGFGFRSGFGVLWFGVCSADRGAVLHTSRPLHRRGVCEISLWSVGYVLSRSASDFVQVSDLVRVSLVGQAPELWNLHMYVNSHDQNIFLFFVFVLNLYYSLVVLCHVMLAINCIEIEIELRRRYVHCKSTRAIHVMCQGNLDTCYVMTKKNMTTWLPMKCTDYWSSVALTSGDTPTVVNYLSRAQN